MIFRISVDTFIVGVTYMRHDAIPSLPIDGNNDTVRE